MLAHASTAALAVVGAVLLAAAVRRDGSTLAAIRSDDRSVQLALLGLLLVLLGWGINLASYWTMHQAALTLTLLTLAALVIVLAGRGLPAVVAWAGIVLAAIAVLVGLDLWGQLSRLGETRLDLGLTDYVPFVVYAAGLVVIIIAGARSIMASRADVPPSSPAA